MIKEKSCGAVVIKDNKVLLVTHNEGHISFPKGHMEEKETEEQTAYREVLEETGIKIKIDTNIREVIEYSPKPNTIKEVVFFKGFPHNDNIKPQLEEVSKVEFVDINKAYKIITYESDREVLKKIIEGDSNEY